MFGEVTPTATNERRPRAHQGFIDRMMQTDIGRRIGYKVARSRTMRPVTARVSRGRSRK